MEGQAPLQVLVPLAALDFCLARTLQILLAASSPTTATVLSLSSSLFPFPCSSPAPSCSVAGEFENSFCTFWPSDFALCVSVCVCCRLRGNFSALFPFCCLPWKMLHFALHSYCCCCCYCCLVAAVLIVVLVGGAFALKKQPLSILETLAKVEHKIFGCLFFRTAQAQPGLQFVAKVCATRKFCTNIFVISKKTKEEPKQQMPQMAENK